MSTHVLPEWSFEFHGHKCPLMPLGYRMGMHAMEVLGVERERDHGLFVFSEMGEGHPQTCMMDGLQIATGCTYGKALIDRLYYGKIAAVLYHPDKGAVRVSVPANVQSDISKFEFFAYRKKGIEASQVPDEITDAVIRFVMEQPIEKLVQITDLPEFKFNPTPSSFNKAVCSICGEPMFERYARILDGKTVCVPCSHYVKRDAVSRL